MARKTRSEMMGLIAPGKAFGRVFNLHNQALPRMNRQGTSGFTIEFLGPGQQGKLDEYLADGVVAVRGAAIEAVVSSTDAIKQRVRQFMDARFSGSAMHGNNHRRVANAAAQSIYYDDLEASGGVAGLVYSKFGVGKGTSFVDYLLLHLRGGTIAAKGGGYLFIRNLKVVEANFKGANVGSFGSFRIELIPAKDGATFYLVKRWKAGGQSQLLATMKKSITVKPSLQGLDTILQSGGAVLDSNFNAAWARRKAEAGL